MLYWIIQKQTNIDDVGIIAIMETIAELILI